MARRLGFLFAPELVVGALAVATFVVWAMDGGGADPTSLYPGALFLLGLLAVTVIALLLRSRAPYVVPPRATLVAIGLLGAFAAWNLLSITWADVKGDAWDGANRTVLYFSVFTLFAVPIWRPSSAAIVLGLFAFGIACVALGTMLEIDAAREPLLSFINGKLVDPTGYHNATPALFLMAFFPAAFLASRPEPPWPIRAVMLASAGVLVVMALPAQSRGAAIVFPLALVVYLCVVPDRVRALLWLLPVGAATALTAPDLLDIYSTFQDGGDFQQAVSQGTTALILSALALLVIGALTALADRAVPIPARVSRGASRAVGALAVVAAVVGLAVAITAIGDPVAWAQARWDDFKGGYGHESFASSRFTGELGSNRYDFWRVGIDEFADHPLTGVGADNFAVDYLRERRSQEEPQHPHSLEIRVLSQTGLVGSVLFGGFLVAAWIGVGRVRRRAQPRLTRGIAAVAIVVSAYWLLHSSGDWLWVFPAVTAPALAFLAMAGRLELSSAQDETEPQTIVAASPRPRAAAWIAAAVLAVAVTFVAGSYLLPLIAAEDVDAAAGGWRSDPNGAFDRLDQAANLNFLSDEADVVAGAIAERLRRYGRMRASFEAALDRNPYNWYSRMELGALEAVEGDRAAALTQLRSARDLNPREELITEVLADVRQQRTVSLRALDRALLGRVCARFGQTEATRFCN